LICDQFGVGPCAASRSKLRNLFFQSIIRLYDTGQVDQAIEIMRQAGTETCGGFEIGVEVEQRLEGGQRYSDKQALAKSMWATIMAVLAEIGALSEAI
jgi:hypothetical protein